jgi:hypothetical protein
MENPPFVADGYVYPRIVQALLPRESPSKWLSHDERMHDVIDDKIVL